MSGSFHCRFPAKKCSFESEIFRRSRIWSPFFQSDNPLIAKKIITGLALPFPASKTFFFFTLIYGLIYPLTRSYWARKSKKNKILGHEPYGNSGTAFKKNFCLSVHQGKGVVRKLRKHVYGGKGVSESLTSMLNLHKRKPIFAYSRAGGDQNGPKKCSYNLWTTPKHFRGYEIWNLKVAKIRDALLIIAF